jgi:hypothetical protein
MAADVASAVKAAMKSQKAEADARENAAKVYIIRTCNRFISM